MINTLKQRLEEIDWVRKRAIECGNEDDMKELNYKYIETDIAIQLFVFHKKRPNMVDLEFLKKHY